MDSFTEAYRALNAAQRKAVDAIDGPVLVVAGPGTGKTQLLGMRVATILQKTDTDPSAILCLTFTNKAATNMRDRLLRLVGPAARTVMVKTFHSFAAEVMNMYPDAFWDGARLVAAPDAVQLEIIGSILGELPPDHPLGSKFAGQFTQVKPVQTALKLTKEAGLTPEQLRAIINLNLAYIDEVEPQVVAALAPTLSRKRLPDVQAAIDALPPQGIRDDQAPLRPLDVVLRESLAAAVTEDEPTGKTTHVSKWKGRWLQTEQGIKGLHDERRRNQWWLAVTDTYEQYRQTLHTRGYYDYADMLVEVITQLERRPDLRASVQERFLYVLIDEFQDTNAAQMHLAQLVADHFSAAGQPNIMAVGDDDQAIYKFNGAELNNMLSFRRIYPSAQLFVLTENYRSTQAVLDTAQRVIQLAGDRLVKREPDLVKTLRAAKTPAASGSITHVSYASRDHQLSHVARTIQAERANNPDHSIAVLARSHDSLKRLASILGELGVPVAYEQSNDALNHPAVVQLILLAKTVAAIQEGDEGTVNALLADCLRHPMWRLDATQLWRVAVDNYGRRADWLTSLASHPDEAFQNIAHWLLWVAGEAAYQPLAVIIEYLLGLRAGEHRTSPLREYYLQSEVTAEYIEALSAIRLLLSLVAEFAAGGRPTVADFVHFVTTMQTNGQIVADETPFARREQAVELYTVHKAKGLEFDSVYVVDAVEKYWQPTSGGRKPPANLPLQPNGDDADDYVRLMYVALTRAKHSLSIASYRTDDSGAEILATPLVRSTITEQIELAAEESGEPLAVLEEAIRWPRVPPATEHELLRPRLDQYHLSATHLIDFLDVTKGGPATFLETKLLCLPEAPSAAVAFGNAMHAALEQAQKLTNAGDIDLARVQNTYEEALSNQHLPQRDYDRYLIHGQGVLTRLLETLHYSLPAGGLPEQKLSVLLPGGAELAGKLDRVHRTADGMLHIADYKTGEPLSSFTTHDQKKAIKAWRHKTQLAFYALLASQSGRFAGTHDIEGCMVYVEAETTRELELAYLPGPDDLARLTQLIGRVWQHIKALDLPDTSAYTTDIAGIHQFEQDLLDGNI
ncbi:MAG TPA: ATP-dependent DNA helicase [Candidatus Saccharimonadales bacterium]|nr:ATP-dependent DNA helicase [Candidatus Saccharimonadales bacterium]